MKSLSKVRIIAFSLISIALLSSCSNESNKILTENSSSIPNNSTISEESINNDCEEESIPTWFAYEAYGSDKTQRIRLKKTGKVICSDADNDNYEADLILNFDFSKK